jgi:hypothetical protein
MFFGIRLIVQVAQSTCHFSLFRAAVGVVAGLSIMALTSCSLFSNRDGTPVGYQHPLIVSLRSDMSVAGAKLAYQDACGQAQSFLISTSLQNMLKRKTGLVFEKVLTGDVRSSSVPDGYVDAALDLAQVDLAIVGKANKRYPATVTIGLDFSYTAADGAVFYSKKIQSTGRGEVDVTETSCEVKGLDAIAQEAIGLVTDGMAQQLGTSTKVVAAAQVRKGGDPKAMPSQSAAAVPVPVPVDGPATLIFRAIVRNENRVQVLHSGEAVAIEIEVKNEGPGTAQAVELSVTAAPLMIEGIPAVVSIGDLAPGEVKHLTLDGKVGAVNDAVQEELTLTLHAGSPSIQLPSAKKFLVAMKPGAAVEAVALPVDVDQPANRASILKQPKAVGIAIGVGRFQENSIARVKYAAMPWSWPRTSDRLEEFLPNVCAPSSMPMLSRAIWLRCLKSGCLSWWTLPPSCMCRSRGVEWLSLPPVPYRSCYSTVRPRRARVSTRFVGYRNPWRNCRFSVPS